MILDHNLVRGRNSSGTAVRIGRCRSVAADLVSGTFMATPTLTSVRQLVDSITSEYEANFAGQSRATRDLSLMDRLISRMRAASGQIESIPRSAPAREVQELRDTVRDSIKLYEQERTLIVQARDQGPEFAEFGELGGAANLVFAQYQRHFAGRGRNTRDLGLLAEMIDDLTGIQEQMEELIPRFKQGSAAHQDLQIVRENLKMYLSERGEIVEARNAGTQAEQASTLAEVANLQFALYQDHFANKSRLTRRPGLLQRVIDNLSQVLDRMNNLKRQGLSEGNNDRNIGIVEGAIRQYESELVEIRKVREATALVDIMGNLGDAANQVMEEYGRHFEGKDRRTRGPELDRLSRMCDQLGEISRQMSDLDMVEANDMNRQNLGIVMNNRSMLEREWTLITEANPQSGPRTN